jgi:hypothetical protein
LVVAGSHAVESHGVTPITRIAPAPRVLLLSFSISQAAIGCRLEQRNELREIVRSDETRKILPRVRERDHPIV